MKNQELGIARFFLSCLAIIFLTGTAGIIQADAATPQVAAGGNHTVGLNVDGTVVAVGDNSYGQCNVTGWTGIIQIAAGAHHTVGLKSDGTVIAAGFNSFNQCDVSNWNGIIQVAAGYYHTIGLKADGTVVAVGRDNYGQCGVTSWTDISQITAGSSHTVGLKSDRTVVAVGNDNDGQCNVTGWTGITRVSAGSSHTVGLKADGTVIASGHNSFGQCDTTGWSSITGISAGSTHTVGLKADGTVIAVGNNGYGQCNVTDWADILQVSAGSFNTVGLKADGTVVAIGYEMGGLCNVIIFSDIVQISAGGLHTVGLTSEGTVLAVGDDSRGQCNTKNWTDVVQISAGDTYTVGLRSNGTVVAVGDNAYYKCDVSGWTDISQIAAGYYHTVGLKSGGTVDAIGANIYGQCDVEAWTGISQLAVGKEHTIGLKEDGTVIAAGNNTHGQCDVTDWTDVIQIEAGYYHTVGLKSDGTVVATGYNTESQCDVAGWTGISQINAGNYHTVGLASNGTVVAVGFNHYNQCDVADWSDIIQVGAGQFHTVGLTSGGIVIGKGHNYSGQLNFYDWLLDYPDSDNDGYQSDVDCNDNDNTIYPDAPELCDGILNSCNGAMLPGEIDNDGDGYVECLVDPAEWKGIPAVIGGGDADDTDETVHPGAPELCDGILNNCDGTMLPTEVDSDGDGYVACTIDPAGWKGDINVIGGGDADDADADVYPEAPETCDGKDNDQNGMIDDDFSCSHLVTASDNFDSSEFNRLAWEIREEDDGVIGTSLSNGQLIMTQPTADHNQGDSVRTNCLFFGDFDVVVDFDLLDSDPVAAGLNLGIEARTYGSETMMDVARWRDGYIVHFLDGYHYAHRNDTSGKLKFSRRGNTMTGYYFDGHHFVEIGSGQGSADPVAFSLVLYTDPNSPYTQVVFDNFTVHSEDALCAQEPDGFRYDIEYFSITGNRPGDMIDEFDDGDLWEGVNGTVFESDGRLTLTDPGEIELESEDGHFIVIAFSENYTSSDAFRIQDGQGDFTAECMWLSPTLYKNTGFNLGAKLRDDSGRAQAEFYIIFSSIEEGESSYSGLPEGTQISFIYESDPLDTEQVWSDPVDPADVHDVIFQLEFIDALNQFSAYCSLNGAAGPFRLIGSPVIVDISDINAVEWHLETSVFDQQTPCRDIFDADYDMDGKDIFLYLNDNKGVSLSEFAEQFGRTNCL